MMMARRSCPLIMLAGITLSMGMLSGCSVCRYARLVARQEPQLFEREKDRKASLAAYRAAADQAWVAVGACCPEGCQQADFREGFREGFAQFVYAGGNGAPPAVPPRQYWGVESRSSAGRQAVQSWFEGHQLGVQVAQDGGYRRTATVVAFASVGDRTLCDNTPCDDECESCTHLGGCESTGEIVEKGILAGEDRSQWPPVEEGVPLEAPPSMGLSPPAGNHLPIDSSKLEGELPPEPENEAVPGLVIPGRNGPKWIAPEKGPMPEPQVPAGPSMLEPDRELPPRSSYQTPPQSVTLPPLSEVEYPAATNRLPDSNASSSKANYDWPIFQRLPPVEARTARAELPRTVSKAPQVSKASQEAPRTTQPQVHQPQVQRSVSDKDAPASNVSDALKWGSSFKRQFFSIFP